VLGVGEECQFGGGKLGRLAEVDLEPRLALASLAAPAMIVLRKKITRPSTASWMRSGVPLEALGLGNCPRTSSTARSILVARAGAARRAIGTSIRSALALRATSWPSTSTRRPAAAR
jgi:hypothetical protein